MAEKRRVELCGSGIMLLWLSFSLFALTHGQLNEANNMAGKAIARPFGGMGDQMREVQNLVRQRRSDFDGGDAAPAAVGDENQDSMMGRVNVENMDMARQAGPPGGFQGQDDLNRAQPMQNNMNEGNFGQKPESYRANPKLIKNYNPNIKMPAPGIGKGIGQEHVNDVGGGPPAAKLAPAPKSPSIKLIEHPACRVDIKQYCSSATNNFAILDCLQNDLKSDQDISTLCQNVVWDYKFNLTTDVRFESAAKEVCKDDLSKISDCKALHVAGERGNLIPCLIDYKSNITIPSCKTFLTKMASIVFSDYRLIQKLVESCSAEIGRHSCGRLHEENDHNRTKSPHSQGRTVECLSQHVKELNSECKHEILRIAELQADDYHLDRPLFFACRDDRERLCQRTKAGSGKVYKCLMRHKFEREMSTKCREKLTQRQVLMQANFKVNKGLAQACQRDIMENHCIHDSDPGFKQARLSKVVLCLESVMKDGGSVEQDCVIELKEVRKSLMEDYKVTPEIVDSCADDINTHCGHGIQREGATLHCLMDLARPKLGKGDNQIVLQHQCLRELEKLIKEADVGEDWSLDPALRDACQSMVDVHCSKIQSGEGRVLSCLMEHLDSNNMNADCEERLMEIHYFLARDFSLDPRLYRQCHNDAENLCHADAKWHEADSMKPEQGPFTFACLYRHLKLYAHQKEGQLSRACAFEVRRVMRQRAVSVQLEPRIEEPCMGDLGAFCSSDVSEKQEMQCLQKNFEELTEDCQYAVGNFTEDEDIDPNMDRLLMKACSPMIKDFCEDEIKKDAGPGDVMECLIRNKDDEDMDEKCAAGIKHHQLITLEDYHFSVKFKEACKEDVIQNCKGSRKKAEVVECLSKLVRDAVLRDAENKVSRKCRKQLSFELLQRSEDIELDPELMKHCKEDRRKFCSNLTPGQSNIVDCLKKNEKRLSQTCDEYLFKREEESAIDPRADYLLMHTCKSMIKANCMKEEPSKMFFCLVKHKDDDDFDDKCKHVLIERMRQKNTDIRLSPVLLKSCGRDIMSFCQREKEYQKTNPLKHEGKVISCLKLKFAEARGDLSESCQGHLRGLIKEVALDYKQDPQLVAQCKTEISQHCSEEADTEVAEDPDGGRVIACLKEAVASAKINLKDNRDCIKEVARILAEDRADIQVDPLLYRECALDIKHYCFDVPRGEGRQMSCLLAALDDNKVQLRPNCNRMLRDRVKMWEMAAQVAPPSSLMELARQVTLSESRNYFFGVIFTILGFIFLGGLMCGRITKRVRQEMKNR